MPVAPTGNPSADAAISQVVEMYRMGFVGRPISCYLIGSYAEGSANALSDIDLIVVAVGWSLQTEDRERDVAIQQLLPVSTRIDVAIIALNDLGDSRVGVNVKHGGRLIYGDDIRELIQLPPLGVYRRLVTDVARDFMARVLRGADTLRCPLEYPEPRDEFFGYARVRLAPWYPPGTEHGLKELVSTSTRIATALVALQSGSYVGSKGESIRLYREVIGDEWANLLTTFYRKGKMEWMYLPPSTAEDRAELRDLCAQFLYLERHFLAVASSLSDR